MKPVDPELLRDFEQHLDPAWPERPGSGATVVGYGEISTVLALAERPDLIVKRMAGFASRAEVAAYGRLVEDYCACLEGCGVTVLETAWQPIETSRNGRVVYLIQPRLAEGAFGNAWVRQAGEAELRALLRGILARLQAVWIANLRHGARLLIGLDAQISNWAVLEAAEAPVFVDVGSPFLRRQGREQQDAEIGLRAMPAPLAFVFRRFLLGRVLERYYDLRAVVRDLVANFVKEGRADRIGLALEEVNAWLAGHAPGAPTPLGAAEVLRYYRGDARLWTAFQAARRLDRFVRRRLLGRPYAYVLPGRIRR